MTKLTKKDVLRVAQLANLKLSEDEVEKFLPQLAKIIEYVSQLDEVDTSNVSPTSQTTGLTNVFRNDEIKTSSLNRDLALSGTEDVYNGFFKVPAILSERSDK
jgi:aspartyl-tRNA(Asn)/glutamyl-tRNA(Gln) amidotransferase subunit C